MPLIAKSETFDRPPPRINVAALPAELKERDQWVVWRKVTRKGKATKVPYRSLLPHLEADSTDPATWSTLEEACDALGDPRNRLDGIGFAFAPDDGLAGVDLDNCLDEAGNLAIWAREVLDRLPGYAEISPSGRGVKLFLRGEVPFGKGRKLQKLGDGSGVIECYDRGRYFTVTGYLWARTHAALADSAKALADFHADTFPAPGERPRVTPTTPQMGDAEIVQKAMAAKNGAKFAQLWRGDATGYPSKSEADLALASLIAFYTQDPSTVERIFGQSGLADDKWADRPDYRALTVGKALERTATHDAGYRSSPPPRQDGPRVEPADPSGWPAPRLDGPEPSPAFPIDALPGALRDLIGSVAESMTCPPDFVSVAALGMASGAMGRSVALRIKSSWIESASLYVSLVGSPGMTKSPPLAFLAKPLWDITHDQLRLHKAELDRHKREAKKDAPAPEPARRLIVDDVTVERLAGLLGENPRGILIVCDELSGMMSGLNQYKAGGKGNDRQFFLKAWSGGSTSVDRKSNLDGRPVTVSHPFLSIVGGMQPEMLSEFGEAKGRDDGFVDRLLFAAPDPVKVRWTDREVEPELIDAWRDAITGLWNGRMESDDYGQPRPFFVRFTPEARDAYACWFDMHQRETEHEDFQSHLGGPWAKFRSYAARLALLIEFLGRAYEPGGLEGPRGEVGVEALSRALVLADYFKKQTRRVRSMMRGGFGDNVPARKLLNWARKKGLARFKAADARHNFPKNFPADGPELDRALAWLVARHAIRPAMPANQKPGPGRPPSPEYEVNPALLGDQTGEE